MLLSFVYKTPEALAMKSFFRMMILVLAPAAIAAQTPGGAPPDALDGLDPVMLVQGKEVEGKSAFSLAHGPFTYLFSTAETKAAFQREPAKYEIQLGGLCARMGKTTGANPADYLVYKGKIYVFGSDECHKRFAANPEKYLPSARVPLTASRALLTKGQQLIEDAARAVGDPKAIDAVTTYIETFSQVQKRAIGEVNVTTKTTWSFPGRVRQERAMSMTGKTMSSATVLAPDGMWFVTGGGQAYPMPAAGRDSLEQDFGRHPFALLKARKSTGLKAASVGPARIEGADVEQVRVATARFDITVNLDAQRRIHSIRFNDRNSEGIYGTYTLLYSDYKTADGLTLPRTVRALFDGQPDPISSWTVDSIAINTPVDPSMFAPKASEPGK
jgi:YHS domain-containing protein